MSDRILIQNCKLYNKQNSGSVNIEIDGSLITSIGNKNKSKSYNHIIDAQERIVCPGFIDVHIHGAGGVDTLYGTNEALRRMSKTLARLGTTSFLATTLVVPEKGENYLKILADSVEKDLGGATVLGIHLEGPFVNPEMGRGIFPESIYPPSLKALEKIIEMTDGKLKMMTIATELDKNFLITKKIVSIGIIPSLGHTNATYEQTKAAFEVGVHHVTHIYNAMPPLHHREPGPLLAIFESENVTAQIISDGRHVSPEVLRWTYKQLGKDRCVCVTDGMQAIGLPEGRYMYNGREYESKDGSAYYLDGTLIGTSLSLGQLSLKFWQYTKCSFETAINTASLIPARVLHIDNKKGSLEKGKDADIVILDFDYSVWATFVNGKLVYHKQNNNISQN